jgi:hypothetical protein
MTCLDCVNFSDDGFCKLANLPAIQQFCNDPANWEDDDMSACPGFCEDL